jgi:transcription elongation factor GreA
MSNQIISKEGYEKLKNELDYILNIKRKEIAERIEHAKEFGDLSENAEYHDAKEAQAFNDGRIIELTSMLKNLTVVENGTGKEQVSMGSKITVETRGAKREFTIVSFNEVDPMAGKISNESPLGIAFLGRKKGDKVVVNTPKGEVEYKIVKID